MNFCTPFLEVYPKDKLHCAQIYNMEELEKNVVPETSVADLAAYIKEQLQLANPLTPYVALDANRVAEAMGVYRNATGRYGTPWRLAYNKTDAVAVGIKLSRQDLTTLLQVSFLGWGEESRRGSRAERRPQGEGTSIPTTRALTLGRRVSGERSRSTASASTVRSRLTRGMSLARATTS